MGHQNTPFGIRVRIKSKHWEDTAAALVELLEKTYHVETDSHFLPEPATCDILLTLIPALGMGLTLPSEVHILQGVADDFARSHGCAIKAE